MDQHHRLRPCSGRGVPAGQRCAAVLTYNKTRRKPLKDRPAFLAAHDYLCHWCGQPITDDEWDDEHIIPREFFDDALGDDLKNRAPIHRRPCHKEKTAYDKANISRSNRVRQNAGLDPIKRKPKAKIKSRGFTKGASRPFPRRLK